MARHRATLTATPEEGTILTIRLGTLGREPALAIIGVLGPLAALVVSVIPGITPGWQTVIESVVYAAAGALTAAMVASDKLAPALMGLATALINLAVAAGAHLDDSQQTAIMTAVSLLVAAFIRTQVDAPLPKITPTPSDPTVPPTVLPHPDSPSDRLHTAPPYSP